MSKSDRKVTVGTKSGSKLSKSGSVFDRLGDSREKHKKWSKKDLDDVEKSSRSTKKAVIDSTDKTRKKKIALKHDVQHKSAKQDVSKIVRKKYEEDDSRHFKSYKPIPKNHPKSISSEEGHRHRIHKMENLIIEKRVSLSPPRHGSRSDSYSSNRSKKGAKKRQHSSLIENPERLERYQSKSPINRSNEKERGRSREPKKKHAKDPIHKSKNSDQDNIKYRENTEKFKESGKAPKPIQKPEYRELPKQKKKLKQTKEVMDSDNKRSQESGRAKVKAIKISSKKSQEYYDKESYVYEDTSDDYRELADVAPKSTKKVVKKHAEHKMKREMAIEQDVIKPKRKRFEAPKASLHHSQQYGSRSQSSDDRDGRRDHNDYKHKTQSSSKNILVKSKQEKVDKYHGGHSKQYSLKEDIAEASAVKSYKKEYYSKSSQGSDVDIHDSYSSNSAEESKKKKKIRKKKRKETNPDLKDVDKEGYDEDREDKISEKQNKKVVKKRMGKRKREDRSQSYSESGDNEVPAKQQHDIMLEKGKHHKKREIHTAQDFRDEERSHKQINRKVEEKRISPLYRTDKTHGRLEQKLSERGQQDRERHGKDQYRESEHSNRSHPKHVPEKLRTSEYSTPQHHHHPTYMKSVKHHQNDRVQVSTSEWTNDTGRKQARHVRPPLVSVSQPDRHYETPSSKFIPQRNMLDPTFPLLSSRPDHFPRSHSKDSWERNREPAPSRHFIKDNNAPRSRSRSGFSPSKHPMKHIYSQQDNYETTRREREFQSTSRNNSNERQRERQLRSKSRDSRSSSQRVDRIISPHQRSSAYSDKSDHYEHHHDVVDSVGHRMKKPLKSKDSTILKSSQESHNSRPRTESEVTSRSQEDYNTKTRKYKASRSGSSHRQSSEKPPRSGSSHRQSSEKPPRSGSSHRQSSEKPPPKLDDVYRGSKNQRLPSKRHMSQHTRITNDHVRKQKIGSSQGNVKVKKNRDSTLDSATDKRFTKQKKDSNARSEKGDKELGSLIESDKDKRKATEGPTDVLHVGWNELPSQKPSEEREAKPRSSVLEKFSPEFILSQTGIVTSLLRPDILEKVKEMQQAAMTNNENVNRTSVKAILQRGLNVYTEENIRKRLLGYNTRYRHPLVPPLIINAKTYMAAMKTYKLAVKLPVETM